jgi:hypothetical protein
MTTSTTNPAAPQGARFAFKSKGLEVEFEGGEDFLCAQIDHLRPAFERELKRVAADAAKATAATGPAPGGAADAPAHAGPAGAPSLEDFYRRAKSREGRGALQEMIIIFAYFLREYRGKEEFGIENLNACFSLVGVTPPKSLANTMGIMKRAQKFFHSGSRRGQYALTDKGVAYVKRLVGS